MDGLAGIDRLMVSLVEAGAGAGLSLPGVDNPIGAPAYMREVLELGRDRGMPFDEAWAAGFTRLQAPQVGGMIDPLEAETVREQRALLEECRPLWQANYERRDPIALERARVTVRAWSRLNF